jgi:hypothetical protein
MINLLDKARSALLKRESADKYVTKAVFEAPPKMAYTPPEHKEWEITIVAVDVRTQEIHTGQMPCFGPDPVKALQSALAKGEIPIRKR